MLHALFALLSVKLCTTGIWLHRLFVDFRGEIQCRPAGYHIGDGITLHHAVIYEPYIRVALVILEC